MVVTPMTPSTQPQPITKFPFVFARFICPVNLSALKTCLEAVFAGVWFAKVKFDPVMQTHVANVVPLPVVPIWPSLTFFFVNLTHFPQLISFGKWSIKFVALFVPTLTNLQKNLFRGKFTLPRTKLTTITQIVKNNLSTLFTHHLNFCHIVFNTTEPRTLCEYPGFHTQS